LLAWFPFTRRHFAKEAGMQNADLEILSHAEIKQQFGSDKQLKRKWSAPLILLTNGSVKKQLKESGRHR